MALTGRCTGALGQFVTAMRTVSGLTVLFFVPGVFVVPWICRQSAPNLSAALGWAFAGNVVLLVAATTALKYFGGSVTAGSFFVVLTLLSLLTGAAFVMRFRHWSVRNDMEGLGRYTGVGAMLLLVFVALTTRPMLPSEHDYFTGRDSWKRLAAMATVPIDLAQWGVSYELDDGWSKVGEHGYRPSGLQARIRLRSPGPRFTFRFSAVVQNYEPFDVRVTLQYAGERVHSVVVPSRFIRGKFWDSRQSNNAMVVALIPVLPGETELIVSLSREGGVALPPAVDLIVHDFSNLDKDALWRRFSQRFLIAKIDDVRQHLSLARSLLVSLLPVANTGDTFTADFPLHYYVNSFGLALLGDRLETLWLIHLAKLVVALGLVMRLARPPASERPDAVGAGTRWLVLILTTLVLMNVSRFLPIGDDAAYHDNTIILLLVAMTLFAVERQWALMVVFACLASLTQRPTVIYVGLFMLGGLVWRPYRSGMARSLLAYIGFLVLLAMAICVVGRATGEWSEWRESFAQGDARRLALVHEMRHIPGVTIPYLLRRASVFWLLMFAGAGFLPFLLWPRGGRVAAWVLGATVVYLLPITVGHILRIHYLSLPAVMLGAASARSIVAWDGRRKLCVGLPAVLISAACVVYIAANSRDWELNFGDRVLHFSLPHRAVADGYLNRGIRRAQSGDSNAAIRDFRRAATESPRHRIAACQAMARIHEARGRPAIAERLRRQARLLAQTHEALRSSSGH